MVTRDDENDEVTRVADGAPMRRFEASVEAILDARLAELEHELLRRFSSSDRPSMLTERDMATLLNCDVRTIRRWERSSEIPQAIRVGGAKRWRAETIDEWLQALEGEAS